MPAIYIQREIQCWHKNTDNKKKAEVFDKTSTFTQTKISTKQIIDNKKDF